VWCLLPCCSNTAGPLLCGAPASWRALQGQEALLLLLLAVGQVPATDNKQYSSIVML
jgi:hypothetical protein